MEELGQQVFLVPAVQLVLLDFLDLVVPLDLLVILVLQVPQDLSDPPVPVV